MSRVVHYNIYPRTLKCSAVAKSYVTLAEFHKMKGRLYNNVLTENGSPQAKKLVAYACKPVVVKSYPPALFLYIAKKDRTGIADKQLIMNQFASISQEANFDRKVRIFKSCRQFWRIVRMKIDG